MRVRRSANIDEVQIFWQLGERLRARGLWQRPCEYIATAGIEIQTCYNAKLRSPHPCRKVAVQRNVSQTDDRAPIHIAMRFCRSLRDARMLLARPAIFPRREGYYL
jgi:hypothetical protein